MEIQQRKVPRLWRGLAIAFALFVIASNILYIAYAFGDLAGTLGGSLTLVPGVEAGVARASAVGPGSPLARAGVTEGAKVRLDHPYDAFRYIWAGEQVGVTLLDAAPPRHVEITVAPNSPDERLRLSRLYLIDGLSALVASIVGLIILLRSGGALSLIVLGLAFAGFDYTISPLQSDPGTIAAWHVLRIATRWVTPLLFLDFALRFYRENVAPLARWVRPLFAIAVLVAGIAGIAAYASDMRGFLLVPAQAEFLNLTQSIIFLSVIAAFVMGWRESIPALQRRYTVMLIALACFMLAALTRIAASPVTGVTDLSHTPFAALMVFEILATAAPLLFAYAVLRHKVVDIGFAVNRALVYGVVSSILLVAFGVVEWASEHFLPIKNLEANALIDGGIALAIFLTFHRLRDLAGHVIEGLFFRGWRENEALLRRFVKEAAFIGSKAALGKAMVAEWTRFSGGAASRFTWQARGEISRFFRARSGGPYRWRRSPDRGAARPWRSRWNCPTPEACCRRPGVADAPSRRIVGLYTDGGQTLRRSLPARRAGAAGLGGAAGWGLTCKPWKPNNCKTMFHGCGRIAPA